MCSAGCAGQGGGELLVMTIGNTFDQEPKRIGSQEYKKGSRSLISSTISIGGGDRRGGARGGAGGGPVGVGGGARGGRGGAGEGRGSNR